MKILHVITGLGTGGAETSLCRLIEALSNSEYAHVVVSLGPEEALSDRIRQSGARLKHLGMRSAASAVKGLLDLRRILRAERPDVIHAWMYHANVAAMLAAPQAGGRLLWGIRQSLDNLPHDKRLTRTVITCARALSGRPWAIVYNSRASGRQHEAFGYRGDKTRIIPNGFDTVQFSPNHASSELIRAELGIRGDAFVIGLVARWHPVKDHEGFLVAAAHFVKQCRHAVFVLVGDGLTAQNQHLLRLMESLGISGHLRLCGHRTDVAAITAALDVACSSSAWGEAFPNAIAEAMACGVPCVATDLGDIREIMGGTGLVIPPRNPPALSAGWLELERMGMDARRSLGEQARRRITERYSLAACAAAYAELYREMTGERPCAASPACGA